MNKKQIIEKIVNDLPLSSELSEMSNEEWYGWFEECWNKAINFTHCYTPFNLKNMKRKKEQYPNELRKGIPSHILLDFRALKLNIECMTKMIDCGYDGQSTFSKEEYEEFTDNNKLQKFKDWYQKILTKYGV